MEEKCSNRGKKFWEWGGGGSNQTNTFGRLCHRVIKYHFPPPKWWGSECSLAIDKVCTVMACSNEQWVNAVMNVMIVWSVEKWREAHNGKLCDRSGFESELHSNLTFFFSATSLGVLPVIAFYLHIIIEIFKWMNFFNVESSQKIMIKLFLRGKSGCCSCLKDDKLISGGRHNNG